MKVVQIDTAGKRQSREVSRKTLALEFDLHMRDLRPIFSLSQVATIFVRGKGIVMNLGVIKILIGRDRVVVTNIENTEVKDKFIVDLLLRLKSEELTSDFELKIMDFALTNKIKKVLSLLESLEKSATKLLKKLDKNFNEQGLEELLLLKKRISKFEIIVKENEDAVLELLDDDEDLADLCLTQSQKSNKNIVTDEIESILESFSDQMEQVTHRVNELSENIDDTQEILSLKLHARRNTIIRYDLIATLVTALFSLFAVVTGLFGMNILNNLENNYEAFWSIVFALFIGFFVFVGCSILYLKKKRIL